MLFLRNDLAEVYLWDIWRLMVCSGSVHLWRREFGKNGVGLSSIYDTAVKGV